MKNFDAAAFKAKFRAAAQARGIDPAAGSTSYQAAVVRGELVFAEKKARAAADHWWANRELWLESSPYHDLTEAEALGHIFAQAMAAETKLLDKRVQPLDEIDLKWIGQEVARALKHDEPPPLPELHRRQRARWVVSAGGVPVRSMV